MTTMNSPTEVAVVLCTRNRRTRSARPSPACWPTTTRRSTHRHRPEHDGRRPASVLEPIAGADRLHYVHVDEAGLSRAYNTGIRDTTGEILAFTDDDCIVPTDWLRRSSPRSRSDPDGELLYGTVVPPRTSGDGTVLTPQLGITEPAAAQQAATASGSSAWAPTSPPAGGCSTPSAASTRCSAAGPAASRRRTTTSPTARTRPARYPAAARGDAAPRRSPRGRRTGRRCCRTTASATARSTPSTSAAATRTPCWLLIRRRRPHRVERIVVKRAQRRPATGDYLRGILRRHPRAASGSASTARQPVRRQLTERDAASRRAA